MGLDISVFKSIKFLSDAECDTPEGTTLERRRDVERLYINPDFSQHDDLVEGFYEVTHSDGFRAGSYSGYNNWRRSLAQMIGTTDRAVWKDPKPGPFVELINFSDCEGVIGPKTSAKLAADFAEWQARADAFSATWSDGDYWLQKYNAFRKAFEDAANTGAVKFC